MEIHVQDGRTISIPDEILVNIFSFLDSTSILNSRLVCRDWNSLIQSDLCRVMLKLEVYQRIVNIKTKWRWIIGFKMWQKQPFERNLLKNNCGQENLNHWTETRPSMTHEGRPNYHFCWSVENPPIGSKVLPQTVSLQGSCFVTSYELSAKSQCINLEKEGLYGDILDDLQPPIEVIEWHGPRTDAGCYYRLTVSLCTDKFDIITSFDYEDEIPQWNDGEWKKVEHTFTNYGPNLKYIYYTHMGKDTVYWAGNYGSKITGGIVRVLLPHEDKN